MTGAGGLPELVAKAFEAACDADSMKGFLAGVADFFDARQGAIVISPQHNPTDILPITFGITADCVREWFATSDESSGRFTRLLPGDTVLENGSKNDPGSLTRHLLGGAVSADEYNRCFMALWRETEQPPFSEPEEETLSVLMYYFRRAIVANNRFVHILSEHKNAMLVLDQSPRAIIILGQNGLPTYMNLEATRILRKNDGLGANEAGLVIDDPATSEKITDFLEQIRTVKPRQFNAHHLATVVPKKSGIAPYKLIVYALPFERSLAALNTGQGLAVLLIYDPEALIDLNTGLLHNFYGLTRAEAALAQSLFIGRSLPEASDRLGISINTTRTQLRSIFKKVGVHSQAALMQEFAKSVAPG